MVLRKYKIIFEYFIYIRAYFITQTHKIEQKTKFLKNFKPYKNEN